MLVPPSTAAMFEIRTAQKAHLLLQLAPLEAVPGLLRQLAAAAVGCSLPLHLHFPAVHLGRRGSCRRIEWRIRCCRHEVREGDGRPGARQLAARAGQPQPQPANYRGAELGHL